MRRSEAASSSSRTPTRMRKSEIVFSQELWNTVSRSLVYGGILAQPSSATAGGVEARPQQTILEGLGCGPGGRLVELAADLPDVALVVPVEQLVQPLRVLLVGRALVLGDGG